jgi:hypothetical protein
MSEVTFPGVQKDGKLVSLANNSEEISIEPGGMIIYAWEK